MKSGALGNKFLSGVAGAVMTVAAALPGGAYAGDSPEVDLSCPAEITVPCGNLRGARGEVVRTAVARASVGDRIVLIHYGDDQDVIDNAERVIRHFIKHGKTAALALADPEEPGEESFQVYIDALPITVKFAAMTDPVKLGEVLNAAIVRSAEVTAMAPTPPQGG